MKTKNLIVFFVLSFLFTACNSQKTEDKLKAYDSKQAFHNEPYEVRANYINSILEQNEVFWDKSEKQKATIKKLAQFAYYTVYIDYVLLESDKSQILQDRWGIKDYNEFLNRAIPTLYYAYSPNYYHSAPEKWGKEAKYFLVNHIPYYYKYGEEKFRQALSSLLDNYSDDQSCLFTFYSESGKGNIVEKKANGLDDNEEWYKYLNQDFWMDFIFSDFKKLSPYEQGDLLKNRMIGVAVMAHKDLTEDERGGIDLFAKKWAYNCQKYLKSAPYNKIPDDRKVMEVWTTIFKNGKNILLAK
jgi:hypothetical protein